VACEDTRVTGGLLRHLNISKPMLAYHEHNEKEVAVQIAERIAGGAQIALITDAGTPGISDPGFRVTRECRRRGLTVTPLPGPCAIVALLSASGLPTNAFRFVGFLPPKSAARRRFLESIKAADETVVLHESCHRISDFLDEMLEELGPQRVVCVGREMTKLHETIRTTALVELVPAMKAGSLKGEFTVAIAPVDFVL
jgi:16S rRNA (cytidine1402-2'-O)-methyltransferase